MKNLWVLLICLTCVASANAETEYMCGSIPFIPNVSPIKSCGSICTAGNVDINNNYINNLYPKAKKMYQQGQCSTVKLIKSYKDECGGMTYEKSTTSGMHWTETVGGNEACRMNQFKKDAEKEREYVQKFINGEVDINGKPIK